MIAADHTTRPYLSDGMSILEHLLDDQSVRLLSSYAGLLGQTGRMKVEQTQVPDSLVLYGDPMFDTVMASLIPVVSEHVGSPVVPTYSFVRLYTRGQELAPHRDRRACQHSITVHLSASSPTRWPIGITDLHQRDHEVDLRPGDGALYQGCALKHWRTACPTDWYLQAFLHFVEADGPFAEEIFDGRPNLGEPPAPKGGG